MSFLNNIDNAIINSSHLASEGFPFLGTITTNGIDENNLFLNLDVAKAASVHAHSFFGGVYNVPDRYVSAATATKDMVHLVFRSLLHSTAAMRASLAACSILLFNPSQRCIL